MCGVWRAGASAPHRYRGVASGGRVRGPRVLGRGEAAPASGVAPDTTVRRAAAARNRFRVPLTSQHSKQINSIGILTITHLIDSTRRNH